MRDYYILAGETVEISSVAISGIEYNMANEIYDGNIKARKVATAELDTTVLDGTYEWYEDGITGIGVWSKVADSNGNLAPQPSVTVTFAEAVSLNSFRLFFGDTYPVSYSVRFLDANGTVLGTRTEMANIIEYSGVKTVVITIQKMKPHQRFKLAEAIFGTDLGVLTASSISACNITAEYSPVANEIPIDSMELSLVSDGMTYSVYNQSSNIAKILKNGTKLRPFVTDNDGTNQLGEFYITDIDSGAGSECYITAEGYMQRISDTECDPAKMYNYPTLWYKQSGRKITGYARRNYKAWQILDIIGLTDEHRASVKDTCWSVNNSLLYSASSSNCRELLQSVLLGQGATTYMRKDGKMALMSTVKALEGTKSQTLDHTLGNLSVTKTEPINAIIISSLKYSSMFCTRKQYSSTDDDFNLEYNSKIGNVEYSITFSEKFLPCAVSVSVADPDTATGTSIARKRFTPIASTIFPTPENNTANNGFYVLSDDITYGKMTMEIAQSKKLDANGENVTIHVEGLERFEMNEMSDFEIKFSDGDNKLAINIPDFKTDMNNITVAWQAYVARNIEVNFETEKTIWIGENVTLPIIYKNYSATSGYKKNVTASIVGVNIDLCTGITSAKGVVSS